MCLVLTPPLPAQDLPRQPDPKTFAAGRVLFTVTDHAILVATLSDPKTPGSRAPVIVPIGSNYIGVILGPVEWDRPDSSANPTRFDAELPQTASSAARHLSNTPDPNEPTDIERMAVAALEMLRPMVEDIHYKIELPAGQPFFELLIADYVPDYGPEVWSVKYNVRQELLQTDFWNSLIQRPAYYQLYPPEKGHPHVAVEVAFPDRAEPGLLDRLARHDPAFDDIAASSPDMAQVAAAMPTSGTTKLTAAPVANFLRRAMPLLNPPTPGGAATKGNLTMALYEDRRGFQWLLPPADAAPPLANGPQQQDSSAPSLRKYMPPDVDR